MKLQLPDVTLMQADTRNHQLAKLAVDDCLAATDFGDVLILSNKFDELRVPGAQHVLVEDWPDKFGYCRALWHQMPLHVKTSHVLIIQWDSHIIRPDLWRDEFLYYDYIGAPWGYPDRMNVGGSGFSLRSKRLMDHLIEKKHTYPVIMDSEDHLLCRVWRAYIEGTTDFRWAPEDVAFDFSVEENRREHPSFGFHGIFNWPRVLGRERLIERARLARQNPQIRDDIRYVSGNSMFTELLKHAPWLAAELA